MADTMVVPGMDGLFGGGLGGGGLIGGLILGSLLRNNGNLFGYGDGVRPPGVFDPQAQANMSLMSGLGDIKQAIAVNSANMETSQALQSSTIQNQLSQVAGALTGTVNGVKDTVNGNTVALMTQLNGVEKAAAANTVALMAQGNGIEKTIMEAQNILAQTITNDGDKTRALIVAQNEANLNRQLSDANAALAELRSHAAISSAARGIEVNTTNNINQMQVQTQQQQQMQLLTGIISNLANDLQYIRATNQAINIGGTQTANPLNTNTNIR